MKVNCQGICGLPSAPDMPLIQVTESRSSISPVAAVVEVFLREGTYVWMRVHGCIRMSMRVRDRAMGATDKRQWHQIRDNGNR